MHSRMCWWAGVCINGEGWWVKGPCEAVCLVGGAEGARERARNRLSCPLLRLGSGKPRDMGAALCINLSTSTSTRVRTYAATLAFSVGLITGSAGPRLRQDRPGAVLPPRRAAARLHPSAGAAAGPHSALLGCSSHGRWEQVY